MLIIHGHWCFVCSGYIELWLKGSWICWECWGGGFGRHHTTDIWDEIPLCYVHYMERLKETLSPLGFKLLLFCSINDRMAALSSHSFSNMLGISVLLDDFISNSFILNSTSIYFIRHCLLIEAVHSSFAEIAACCWAFCRIDFADAELW